MATRKPRKTPADGCPFSRDAPLRYGHILAAGEPKLAIDRGGLPEAEVVDDAAVVLVFAGHGIRHAADHGAPGSNWGKFAGMARSGAGAPFREV